MVCADIEAPGFRRVEFRDVLRIYIAGEYDFGSVELRGTGCFPIGGDGWGCFDNSVSKSYVGDL